MTPEMIGPIQAVDLLTSEYREKKVTSRPLGQRSLSIVAVKAVKGAAKAQLKTE